MLLFFVGFGFGKNIGYPSFRVRVTGTSLVMDVNKNHGINGLEFY